MSNKAIDDFMAWLDCMIEEKEGFEPQITPNPDQLTYESEIGSCQRHYGFVDALKLVEDRAKELGFITPKKRGGSL